MPQEARRSASGVGAVNGNEGIQIIRDFDKKKCWIHVKLLEWQNLFAMFLAKNSSTTAHRKAVVIKM